MILAAGVGTRLRPLTYETPKPMVPIANRPVLEHVLRRLAEHGVKEACLNVWSFPEQVRKFCGDGGRWGIKLSYSFEKTLLGTAGAVKKVQRFLGDRPFFVLSGDGLHDVDLTALWRFHQKRRVSEEPLYFLHGARGSEELLLVGIAQPDAPATAVPAIFADLFRE